jgi:hypothetical protein
MLGNGTKEYAVRAGGGGLEPQETVLGSNGSLLQ